jgi:hypothetical protein
VAEGRSRPGSRFERRVGFGAGLLWIRAWAGWLLGRTSGDQAGSDRERNCCAQSEPSYEHTRNKSSPGAATMHHRQILAGILAITSVLLVAQPSEAQFFSPNFSSSTYVDRIVQDAVRPEDVEEESTGDIDAFKSMPAMEAPAAGAPADAPQIPPAREKRFWKDRIISLTYEYSHRNYTAAAPFNDLHADVHLVVPEMHFTSKNGFKLDLSAAYARSDAQDQSTNVIDTDSFVLSVTPGMELLGRNRERCSLTDPQKTFLTTALAIGYRHMNLESAYGGPGNVSNFDALTLIPNVVLTHAFVEQHMLVSGVAAYAYDTSTSKSEDLLANDGSEGIVSLAVRGDYFFPHLPLPCRKDVTTKAYVSVTTAWKHYAQASVRSIAGDDSAEFSTTLSMPIPNMTWTARLGYTYEAFREDYDAHRALFYIEGPLWRLN